MADALGIIPLLVGGAIAAGYYTARTVREKIAEASAPEAPPPPTEKIPWQCWDVGGFKECSNVQFMEAQKRCAGNATCEKNTHGHLVLENCVPKFCPGGVRKTQVSPWLIIGGSAAVLGATYWYYRRKKAA